MNLDKVKEFLKKLSDNGIPNILLQDPITKLPSITYSIFYLNGLIALGGLLGRFANIVKGVDADSAKELLIVSGGLYLGRRVIGNSKTSTEPPTSDQPQNETKESK